MWWENNVTCLAWIKYLQCTILDRLFFVIASNMWIWISTSGNNTWYIISYEIGFYIFTHLHLSFYTFKSQFIMIVQRIKFSQVICFCQLWIELIQYCLFSHDIFFLWKQHVALELKFEHVKRKIFQLWNEVTDFHSVKISTCETPIFLCRSQTFMCDLLFYMRITNSTCGNERFLIWVFNLRSQEIVSMTETQVPRCSKFSFIATPNKASHLQG